jgi:two-component system CheB/CheR fusion protein
VKTKKASLNLQTYPETKVANEFPIVGIGASAGGLEPITKLLENLPIRTGLSFVVIQHLATGQESLLPEILSRSTKMKVQQAKDDMKVEQDQVYVIPPGTTLTLKNGCIKLFPKKQFFKPINDFLISLASEKKTRAIGIVLSGTGNDGTEGLKAIKAEGGITFAQDPDTAQYPDMPKNAIADETPDFVLSSELIAKELVRIAKHPQLMRSKTKALEQEKVETDANKIIRLLKASFGVDFIHYRETTINRRITRRMVINKAENMKAYVEYLRAHPSEQRALFDDMLIGVTSFFREPDTFLALKEKVFPALVANRSSDDSIRVWVPGCSTGEEVYSFAIALREFLEEKAITEIRIQIFGTDANEKSIEKARRGTYPKSAEDKISQNRLKRFFTSDNGHCRIIKFIRDMCIFAKQDITTDPPFSNLDLIMCRNVLIYFDSHLHERVLPIFYYGLKLKGFLVLGESESVGKFQHLFKPIMPKGLIYRKEQAQPQAILGEGTFTPYSANKTAKPIGKVDLLTVLGEKVDRLISTEYGPATLLVNGNLDILVFRGDIAPYLSPESGAASLNVTKIIRKELRSQVQTALYRARKENKVFKETVRFKQKEAPKTVNIEIRPLKTPEYDEPFYLVLFTEATSQSMNSTKEIESVVSPVEMENLKDRQIRELREDLEATKESLQTLVEGQEATNEELRSSMEEVQSSNEELQSTNEELETAKEELQSGNEELNTLNEELKNRNQALGRLNDDLANLQTNIDLPVIIVDNDLKIRRFTVSAQVLLKISPSDVGHSITSINSGILIVNLKKTISDVITKLTSVNREVTSTEGHCYEMRVRPYLTEEKKIDGAVLSFTDITERKKHQREVESLAKFPSENPSTVLRIDRTGTILYRNSAAASLLTKWRSKVGERAPDHINKLVVDALDSNKQIELEETFGDRILLLLFMPIAAEGYVNIYGGDISKHKELQQTVKQYTENLENLVDERSKQLKDSERLAAIGTTAGMVGHDIRNPLQAITGDVYLAKTELALIPESDEKESAVESLKEIEKNIDYINKIVADLQDFARPLNPRAEEADLKLIIEELLAKNGLPENVKASVKVETEACKVIVDSSYINRIMHNLVNNAVQAMPKGGKLSIHAYKEANHVVITVKDTGVGIPEGVKSKLFTPMFTTKAKGQGFGLPVVKRMAEALGGTVTFESQEGKGTTFTVRFPSPK